jgi:hypothetical protein
MKIYCVKIRQRQLRGSTTYFPFERMYLVPHAFLENDYWKGVFPYMLVVESPRELLDLMEKMYNNATIDISADGSPTHTPSRATKKLRDVLPPLEDYRIVVPTYAHKNKLGYMWTSLARGKQHGLELSLYMPTKVIPSMCYQCANLSHKYAGDCQPSDSRCRDLVALDLPKQKGDTPCLSDSDKRP